MMCGSEELWESCRTCWSLSALIIVFWYGWKFGLDEGLVQPLMWLIQGDTGSELYPRHMGLAGDTGSELVPGERNPGVKRGMLSRCFVSTAGDLTPTEGDTAGAMIHGGRPGSCMG